MCGQEEVNRIDTKFIINMIGTNISRNHNLFCLFKNNFFLYLSKQNPLLLNTTLGLLYSPF